MLDNAFQKIKDALEQRWVDAGAPSHATESILNDMDTKQSVGLMLEAADMLKEWIDTSGIAASADELKTLKMVEEARR